MKRRGRWWHRTYIVHPIQRRFFFLSLVPLAICSSLIGLLVFAPLNLSFLGSAADPEKLRHIHALGARIWPAVLISVVASGLLSFVATNQFGGPLHRIEKAVRRIAHGELPNSIRVQQDDDLGELPALLNEACGRIASALTGIRQEEAEAAEELAALHRKAKAGLRDPTAIVQGLHKISHHLREVERTLTEFRLPRAEHR